MRTTLSFQSGHCSFRGRGKPLTSRPDSSSPHAGAWNSNSALFTIGTFSNRRSLVRIAAKVDSGSGHSPGQGAHPPTSRTSLQRWLHGANKVSRQARQPGGRHQGRQVANLHSYRSRRVILSTPCHPHRQLRRQCTSPRRLVFAGFGLCWRHRAGCFPWQRAGRTHGSVGHGISGSWAGLRGAPRRGFGELHLPL